MEYGKIKYTRKYQTKKKTGFIEYDMVIDLSRFGKQLGQAQKELDSAVFTSMIPLMPHETGLFIDITQMMNDAYVGTGTVVAAAPPTGRFLYEGKTMVDESTGSPWARKGARKVTVSQYAGKTNAKPNLTYSHGRQSHWFEEAKRRDQDKWLAIAKKTAGGGNK